MRRLKEGGEKMWIVKKTQLLSEPLVPDTYPVRKSG